MKKMHIIEYSGRFGEKHIDVLYFYTVYSTLKKIG